MLTEKDDVGGVVTEKGDVLVTNHGDDVVTEENVDVVIGT